MHVHNINISCIYIIFAYNVNTGISCCIIMQYLSSDLCWEIDGYLILSE